MEHPSFATSNPQPPPVLRTAVALSALFLADLGSSGQGIISLFVALAGMSLLTVGAVWAAVKGARPLVRSRVMRAGMYLLLGTATIVATRFHVAMAQNHAEQVIEACRAYQARHGMLPDRLQELVPDFLPAVPRAKYTLAWGAFTYSTSAEKLHTLMYVERPPFGRRLYHFEDDRWSRLD